MCGLLRQLSLFICKRTPLNGVVCGPDKPPVHLDGLIRYANAHMVPLGVPLSTQAQGPL